ncbi:MAG: hypothetical protein EBS39_04220, partial [Gammaproteobacteria bacterium]|nr:hypothetical protein [Gammaproteobacteria bacterium]
VQSLDSDGAVRKDLTVDPQGLMTLRTLGGATNPNVIVGDRIVVSNSAGELLQVDTVKLITATTWGLTGNDTITQPGTLGETATGDFLGTTVARDLGLVTNGKIGAMLDSGGIFRTAADLVAAGVSVGRGREPNRLGNTAVGTNSLINNNGGDNNTAYGASALRRATLGGQNTAVGVDALSAIRTGSGNVALGYLAGSTAAIDTADRLFIANSATNNLIYGDFANGRLLINAGATPPVTLGAAALQVNSASAGDVGLVVRGAGGQTANLIEARNNGGTVVASVSNGGDAALAGTLGVIGATTLTGALTANGGISTTTLGTSGAATIGNGLTVTTGTTALGGNATVAGTLGVTGATTLGSATQINNTLAVTGATTLTSLGGAVNSTLGSNDRIVVTKSDGLLSNVSVAGLVAAGAWGLSGNTNVAAGNYLGTTDANDLRLATNGTVRATLTSGGQFQIGNVAISGGTINGTSVGATTASTGRFTTLDATSLATTGAATIGNGLTVTTGGLTVSGGATSLAGTLGVTGLLTATGGVSTPTLAATTSVTTPSVTNAGTLALAATGANAITLATNGTVRATLTSAGVLQAGNVAIGGGTINGTSVGATTASTGRFTTLDATSLATTGDGTVRGALSVTGATTLTGLLEAKSGVTTTSITTSRNGTIGGTLTVTGITTLGTVSTGALTAGALTASTLTTTGNATIGGTLTATGGIEGTAINDTVIGNIKPLAATFTTLAGDTGSFDSVAGDELSGSIKVTTPLVTSSTSLALATATSALQLAAAGGSDYVTVTTSNLERLRVAANGNVGIGTDAPGKQLDVAGTFRATGDSVIGAKLDVTGATTLASTLNVNGVTTLAGMLNANGGVTTGAVTATAVSTGTLTATTSLTSPLLSSTGALSLAATGANDVTISTGGVVRVRIGSDGQVSIGSVDIDGSFRARGASTFDGLLTAGGGIKTSSVGSDASLALTAKDGITASVDGTERLRIDVNGVRIVSGAAGQVGLIVRGASGQTANLLEVQDGAGAAQVIVDETGAMSIGTGAKAATGFKLDVNGNVKVAGDVAANTFTQTSDARFKTNVRAIADALSVVRKLQGVTFDWNRAAFPDRGFSDRPQIGVIAQEVEKVLPELVATDAQGYKSVNYVGFVPVLIEGMKQQADRLDQQAQRLDEQDQRLGAAEKTLAVVEDRLFNTEQQVIKIDERLGKAETFIARFELTRDPDTMVVLTPTFKVQNLTADRAYIAELRAERIEADKARFKELDADGAVIDSVDAARVRGRVVNTGGKELFVSYGTVTPLFDVATDGHYFVSVTSEDGSFATAQVINAGGVVRVVPSASQGIDVVANGTSVGLVAPSKKVKASWTRTG